MTLCEVMLSRCERERVLVAGRYISAAATVEDAKRCGLIADHVEGETAERSWRALARARAPSQLPRDLGTEPYYKEVWERNGQRMDYLPGLPEARYLHGSEDSYDRARRTRAVDIVLSGTYEAPWSWDSLWGVYRLYSEEPLVRMLYPWAGPGDWAAAVAEADGEGRGLLLTAPLRRIPGSFRALFAEPESPARFRRRLQWLTDRFEGHFGYSLQTGLFGKDFSADDRAAHDACIREWSAGDFQSVRAMWDLGKEVFVRQYGDLVDDLGGMRPPWSLGITQPENFSVLEITHEAWERHPLAAAALTVSLFAGLPASLDLGTYMNMSFGLSGALALYPEQRPEGGDVQQDEPFLAEAIAEHGARFKEIIPLALVTSRTRRLGLGGKEQSLMVAEAKETLPSRVEAEEVRALQRALRESLRSRASRPFWEELPSRKKGQRRVVLYTDQSAPGYREAQWRRACFVARAIGVPLTRDGIRGLWPGDGPMQMIFASELELERALLMMEAPPASASRKRDRQEGGTEEEPEIKRQRANTL